MHSEDTDSDSEQPSVSHPSSILSNSDETQNITNAKTEEVIPRKGSLTRKRRDPMVSIRRPQRVMVLIDHDKSTDRAFKEALKALNPQTDVLYLLHVCSTWDYLNTDKHAGKLYLSEYSTYAESSGFQNIISYQVETSSPRVEVLNQITDKEIDVVYTGIDTFKYTAKPGDDFIFAAFSTLKRWIIGSIVDYIVKYSPCKVVVVP